MNFMTPSLPASTSGAKNKLLEQDKSPQLDFTSQNHASANMKKSDFNRALDEQRQIQKQAREEKTDTSSPADERQNHTERSEQSSGKKVRDDNKKESAIDVKKVSENEDIPEHSATNSAGAEEGSHVSETESHIVSTAAEDAVSSDELSLTASDETSSEYVLGLNNNADVSELASPSSSTVLAENLQANKSLHAHPLATGPTSSELGKEFLLGAKTFANAEVSATSLKQEAGQNSALGLTSPFKATGDTLVSSSIVNGQQGGTLTEVTQKNSLSDFSQLSETLSDTQQEGTGHKKSTTLDLLGKMQTNSSTKANDLLQAEDLIPAEIDKTIQTETAEQKRHLVHSLSNSFHHQHIGNAKPVIPVNVSFGRPEWAGMVAERSAMMAAQSIKFAELQLDPPELGPLQVKVSVNQETQQASVSFVSANPQVREALDLSASRLREMLQEQGVDLVDVDVSDQETQAQDQQENAESSAVEDEALAGTLEEDKSTQTWWVNSPSGIDYYA